MGKYRVASGQNIYDVALHIYGSIEGIIDLMMSNTDLSLCTELKMGDVLEFTDDFVIDVDIVAYNRRNNIIPANGERGVYHKEADYSEMMRLFVSNAETSVMMKLSGIGMLQIDWGDNTPIETLILSDKPVEYLHHFNSLVNKDRRVRLWGDCTFTSMDLSELRPRRVKTLRPVFVERFRLKEGHLDIDFLALLQGVFKMELPELKTSSLLPLLENKALMTLDLTGAYIMRETLDEYLIALVKKYYDRRNSIVALSMEPSGECREPERDEHNHYILTSGMEAIWVIVNEPAWNEAGFWKFIIGNKTYTSEP